MKPPLKHALAARLGWTLAVLLALVAPARADDGLDRLRAKIRSKRAKERLGAVRLLAKEDSAQAVELLASAVQRSHRDMGRVGKSLDRADAKYQRKRTSARKLERDTLASELNLHLAVLRDAGRVLSSYRDPAAVDAVGRAALEETEPYLRQLYVVALGYAGQVRSLPILLEFADHADVRLRATAARALRRFAARKDVVNRLTPLGQDPCWSVRLAAYETLARAPLDVALPILIDAVLREQGEVAQILDDLLAARTGKSFADNLPSWKAWWTEHEEAVLEGTFVDPPECQPPRREGGTRPAFFDIPIDSTNVAFVIDYSASMRADFELRNPYTNETRAEFKLPATRLGNAKAELIRALRKMPDGALFDIITYGDGTRRFSRVPTKLDDASRRRAIAWILKQDTEVMTNVWEALLAAYRDCLAVSGGSGRFPKVADTIVLLTDGDPTRGRLQERAPLVEMIRMWNWAVGASVICIGLGTSQDRRLLDAFAKATNGLYVDLTRPSGPFDRVRRRMHPKERTPAVAPRRKAAVALLGDADAAARLRGPKALEDLGRWAVPARQAIEAATRDADPEVAAATALLDTLR